MTPSPTTLELKAFGSRVARILRARGGIVPIAAGLLAATLLAGAPGVGLTSDPCEGRAPAVRSCAGAASGASSLSPLEMEGAILCLINQERTARGITRLRLNAGLHAAAELYAQAMVSQGFFSHTSPQGGTFTQRITASGYLRKTHSWLVGENLAWGSLGMSTPASMVAAWLASPPHRANVLRKRFRDLGIAAVSGTPSCATNAEGTTITTEYGYRGGKQ